MNNIHQLQTYRGVINQQGYGLGSIFSRLFRAARPFIKSGSKYVARKAIKASYNSLNDMLDGVPPSTAVKRNIQNIGSEVKNDVKAKVRKVIHGRGKIKKKRKKKAAKSVRVPKRKTHKRKQLKKLKKCNNLKIKKIVKHVHGDLF